VQRGVEQAFALRLLGPTRMREALSLAPAAVRLGAPGPGYRRRS
jgi:hypothetical protein